MKKMNVKMLFAAILATMLLAACDESNDAVLTTDFDTELLSSEAEIDGDMDDVDNFAIEGLDIEVYSVSATGRTKGRPRNHLPDCAEITHDPEAMTITIDFGEECEGRGGKIFSGKILISYTDRHFLPGSIWTTTFEDFTVDGKLIEGLRTVENVSASLEDNPTFHITLVGGKVTFEDGTFATKDADKTKMWVRARNPLEDEFHILDGSTAVGVNKEGVSYSTTVLETLVYKNICKLEGIHIPVDGIKEIFNGETQLIVDFGDGECDNFVTVTSDGVTETVELTRRRRDS